MATTWQELRPKLESLLTNAFNEGELTQLLRLECQRKLADIVGLPKPMPHIIHEVVEAAIRNDWLKSLVQAVQEARPKRADLQTITAAVLAGIEAEGDDFYKQKYIKDEEGEAVLLRQIRPYLKTLQRRTSSVPLANLDQSGKKGGELSLSKVFIGLNVAGERVLAQGSGQQSNTVRAALYYLHEYPQVVLLGDPGSGKSTLLRYMAYHLACGAMQPQDKRWRDQLSWPIYREDTQIEMKQWTEDFVPVMVVLRDFARQPFDPDDSTAVIDFVCDQLTSDDLSDCALSLRELARRGRVFFLLDGVDEVPPNERQAVWAAIKALGQGVYGGNRWAATCRVLSFDQTEAPAGVPVQTLRPFNQTQIKQFIDNWYASLLEKGQLPREQSIQKAAALKTAVHRPELQELAENPMLLTIMALVQTFRGSLPDDRAKLYQACVETLLLRWQLRLEEGSEGDLPTSLQALETSQEDLERLLWEIAWEAHSKAKSREKSADIPRWSVLEIAEENLGSLAKAEQFLEYTEQRAHLLVGRGGRRERVYSFPHRTFQEYLAACHLASLRRFSRRAKELAAESVTWREVLNLAVGALTFNQNNREKAFDAIADMLPDKIPAHDDTSAWRQVWLAGEMCATIGRHAAQRDEVGKEVLPQLRDSLVALLANEALTAQQRAEAGDALGKLGDPRPGVCTLEPALTEIPAGTFLYGNDKEKRQIDKPFAIARYPVTAAQFGMFMDAGGYEEPRYWGGEASKGWRWRVSEHPEYYRGKEPITQPEYWLQPRWQGENRPIVGVSWYEAVAYCAWLTETSGRTYRLPTEYEWERAARHTDGREWAWRNAWEDGIINSKEAQIGRPTAVGAFPRGVAACGAHDMNGNVWEWTASFFDDKHNRYSVRGGSWGLDRDLARVARRDGGLPNLSSSLSGFRVVSPVF